MTAPEDRRRHQRHQLCLAVRFTDRDGVVEGNTFDLSVSGAFLEVERPAPAGAELALELSLPGAFPKLTLAGIVRWSRGAITRDGKELRAGIGIEWTTPLADEVQFRLGFVDMEPDLDTERTLLVLVADDNPHVRQILKAGVSRHSRKNSAISFEFIEAEDGRRALEAIETMPLDLAVLDVNMPILDGVRLLDHLRNSPTRAMLPVLVVSAGGDEARVAALSAGADMFLPKPLRLVDLLDAVERLLRLKSGG